MFDDIKIPVSTLNGLLDKKTITAIAGATKSSSIVPTESYMKMPWLYFQTKSLENAQLLYKVYRKQLYRSSILNKEKWIKDTYTGEILFYTGLQDKNETEHWYEFKFTFDAGKLILREFVDTYIIATKKQREESKIMFGIEQEYFQEHRNKLRVKFWHKLHKLLTKACNYAINKTIIPIKLRKQAYKASGRLQKEPDVLKKFDN